MTIQTLGMLFHRGSTFLHIMATTKLPWSKSRELEKRAFKEALIELAKEMGSPIPDEEDAISTFSVSSAGSSCRSSAASGAGDIPPVRPPRRKNKSVYKIQARVRAQSRVSMSVNEAFEQRFERICVMSVDQVDNLVKVC